MSGGHIVIIIKSVQTSSAKHCVLTAVDQQWLGGITTAMTDAIC